jgi:hypothetical protein
MQSTLAHRGRSSRVLAQRRGLQPKLGRDLTLRPDAAGELPPPRTISPGRKRRSSRPGASISSRAHRAHNILAPACCRREGASCKGEAKGHISLEFLWSFAMSCFSIARLALRGLSQKAAPAVWLLTGREWCISLLAPLLHAGRLRRFPQVGSRLRLLKGGSTAASLGAEVEGPREDWRGMRAAALLVITGVALWSCAVDAVPTIPPEPAPHAAGPFAALTRQWDAERRAVQVVDSHGCDAIMGGIGADLNDACCADPKSRCEGGAPHSCSRACATLWMPFQKECSLWLLDQFPEW